MTLIPPKVKLNSYSGGNPKDLIITNRKVSEMSETAKTVEAEKDQPTVKKIPRKTADAMVEKGLWTAEQFQAALAAGMVASYGGNRGDYTEKQERAIGGARKFLRKFSDEDIPEGKSLAAGVPVDGAVIRIVAYQPGSKVACDFFGTEYTRNSSSEASSPEVVS